MHTLPGIEVPFDTAAETRRQRLLLGAVMLGLLALSLTTLQATFDAGDRRRAISALASTPAAGAEGPSLAHLLRERGGGQPPDCEAEVLSAARGITRVTCAVRGDPELWLFRWDDLRRARLEPENEATRRRLGEVAGR